MFLVRKTIICSPRFAKCLNCIRYDREVLLRKNRKHSLVIEPKSFSNSDLKNVFGHRWHVC